MTSRPHFASPEPSEDRARQVADALTRKDLDAPSPDDVVLFLDLRQRIETYLKAACEAWMADLRRTEPHIWNGSFGQMEHWDAALVRYTYLPHTADYDDQRETIYIPIADLLPEFAEQHAALAALAGKAPRISTAITRP